MDGAPAVRTGNQEGIEQHRRQNESTPENRESPALTPDQGAHGNQASAAAGERQVGLVDVEKIIAPPAEGAGLLHEDIIRRPQRVRDECYEKIEGLLGELMGKREAFADGDGGVGEKRGGAVVPCRPHEPRGEQDDRHGEGRDGFTPESLAGPAGPPPPAPDCS